MARVEGQVAVVTGGASGIRRAAAGLLASEGAAVVIGDLQEQKAAGAPAEIRDAGGRALGLAVDVMDEASLAGLVDAAVSEFGRLDVLCNQAGGSNPQKDLDVLGMDLEEFDRTMRLNVRSVVLGCRLAISHLIEAGGGSIVNTASVSGLSGDVTQTAYGTSKAAMIWLTQYVATQYGPTAGPVPGARLAPRRGPSCS